jgi:hypothetical protein
MGACPECRQRLGCVSGRRSAEVNDIGPLGPEELIERIVTMRDLVFLTKRVDVAYARRRDQLHALQRLERRRVKTSHGPGSEKSGAQRARRQGWRPLIEGDPRHERTPSISS